MQDTAFDFSAQVLPGEKMSCFKQIIPPALRLLETNSVMWTEQPLPSDRPLHKARSGVSTEHPFPQTELFQDLFNRLGKTGFGVMKPLHTLCIPVAYLGTSVATHRPHCTD